MKQNRSYLIIALATTLLIINGCNKEESDELQPTQVPYPFYFEGKVNGVLLELVNGGWSCSSTHSTYYPDGYLDFHPGFVTFSFRNCDTSEGIYLGKMADLQEGVFTSTDTADHRRPWCSFADHDYDFLDQNGYPEVLRANHELEIRLEIIRFDSIQGYQDNYYIEGSLDAVVCDTITDSTVVISDVKFGRRF